MVGNLGFYEFTRMLFGLCNALAMFQCLMQNTLEELNLTYCVIYLDDVIVFSCMEEEHLECLHVVSKRFREFNLKLKPSKCSFFQLEIMYLAHHVSQRENVWAVQEFPMPEIYMQVHVFCRLVGDYRRFIKGFANIVHPLYDMLGKEVKMGPLDLPPKAWEAVGILKGKVQSAPVLVSWCSLTLTSLSCWRWMPPRRDWEQCSPRNRVMDGIILLPLGAAP